MTTSLSATDESVQIVDRACVAIESNLEKNFTLEQLAQETGTSPKVLTKSFRDRLGVTPRQFREAVRIGEMRAPAFLPASWGPGGDGAWITYAIDKTSFGHIIVASGNSGIVAVNFGYRREEMIEGLEKQFPRAEISEGQRDLDRLCLRIVQAIDGTTSDRDFLLEVRASEFQKKVWIALLRIPRGETRTFGELAAMVGQPDAQRAVARAVGSNRFAGLVPCHRVVRSDGSSGNYPWGLDLKYALMEREIAA